MVSGAEAFDRCDSGTLHCFHTPTWRGDEDQQFWAFRAAVIGFMDLFWFHDNNNISCVTLTLFLDGLALVFFLSLNGGLTRLAGNKKPTAYNG